MLNSPTVKAPATESPVRIRTADLMAVSPSGPIPPKAPETRSANPETASLPETAMARKLIRIETRSAAIAPQSGSRAGAKSRVRNSGNRGHLTQHHPTELLVACVWRGLAGDSPAEEDEDPVAQLAQLVEIEG